MAVRSGPRTHPSVVLLQDIMLIELQECSSIELVAQDVPVISFVSYVRRILLALGLGGSPESSHALNISARTNYSASVSVLTPRPEGGSD